MQRVLLYIDSLSLKVGHAFAWCILLLTLAVCYEVILRKIFRNPTAWAFDVSYIMYGTLFMMGGAYALSRDSHVRADFLFRLWPPRVQAGVEFVLYIIFFFPGVLALVYSGYDFARESWSYRPYGPAGPVGEISINSPVGVPVSPLKTVIPVAAFFLLLQGIAQIIRCAICLRTGEWPPRLHDVEETDVALRAAIEARKRREAEKAKGAGG
ncbi:MAG: TRAP transporter small permease subunit [Candidatus Tectomicrobia bacterium]|uniref:TRAP transporter small permease subunit n=1 Tax=Tectimicrobiota bacterium TaxID=2528274 RepID=A0A932HW12_UNCTE|nr:TRAP transporter small permease subunit [Candidatus Tectomicrobia bacterium]